MVGIRYDCDADALLILVEPKGPACHTGEYSCFHHRLQDEKPVAKRDRFAVLNVLESVIAEREAKRPEGSYTTYLFEKGIDKIAKSWGRSSRSHYCGKNRSKEELRWEVADLLYHLLVLLREQRVSLDDVLSVLAERHR